MRLLPGVTGEQAVRELRRTIDDRRVKIVVGSDDQTPAEVYQSVRERQRIAASSTDTRPLPRAGARDQGAVPGHGRHAGPLRGGDRRRPVARARHPGLRHPALPGLGRDLEHMHGIDERVSIAGLNQGTDMVERILRAVATG